MGEHHRALGLIEELQITATTCRLGKQFWREYIHPAPEHPWPGPILGLVICALALYVLARAQQKESDAGPKAYYHFIWIIGTMLYLLSVLASRLLDYLL